MNTQIELLIYPSAPEAERVVALGQQVETMFQETEAAKGRFFRLHNPVRYSQGELIEV